MGRDEELEEGEGRGKSEGRGGEKTIPPQFLSQFEPCIHRL